MAEAVFPVDFRKAEPLLKNVLAARAGGKWQQKADKLYKRVQRIMRSAANHTLSDIATRIAVKDEVSRGDVAALLADELKLDRLFAGRMQERQAEERRVVIPTDMLEHPFKEEAALVMKWNVRGLQPIPDGERLLFEPARSVLRKELALTLEDVIIRLTGDEGIATAQVGEKSDMPDVPSSSPWFNAARTVTGRGLMERALSGAFRPDDPVDGAELLLAIFKLRNVMDIH